MAGLIPLIPSARVPSTLDAIAADPNLDYAQKKALRSIYATWLPSQVAEWEPPRSEDVK